MPSPRPPDEPPPDDDDDDSPSPTPQFSQSVAAPGATPVAPLGGIPVSGQLLLTTTPTEVVVAQAPPRPSTGRLPRTGIQSVDALDLVLVAALAALFLFCASMAARAYRR
jgi:hypothetical protein